MPPRSVSAFFGTFNGDRIVRTTAILCLGATQEPFRFAAMPRLKFFQGHGLPFPVSELVGMYDGMADTSMWRSRASHTPGSKTHRAGYVSRGVEIHHVGLGKSGALFAFSIAYR